MDHRSAFAPYLTEARGAHEDSVAFYVWNAQISAALFETLRHIEVLLRNSIDGQFALLDAPTFGRRARRVRRSSLARLVRRLPWRPSLRSIPSLSHTWRLLVPSYGQPAVTRSPLITPRWFNHAR